MPAVKRARKSPSKSLQKGGTLAGILIGLVIAFAFCIGVWLYSSKMPIPFLKQDAHTRPSALDATDEERNRTWNPNAWLSKNQLTQPEQIQQQVQPEPVTENVDVAPPPENEDILGELAAKLVQPEEKEVKQPPPLRADPHIYFVQAGAFRMQDDAEAQRAKLAISGWDARITSSDKNGQVVYRVRVGPFEKSSDAASLKRQLDQLGVDAAVVRQSR